MPHQGEIPDGRDFELIETLRWTRSAGFYLLDDHVARLRRSAAALGFRCAEGDIRGALARTVEGRLEETLRIRLTLARNGAAAAVAEPLSLPRPATRWGLAIASVRFDSKDPLLRHKTTRRAFLEDALAEAQEHVGADEALFLNERDELCEGARSNLFVAENGALLTPAAACGLLPGTLRGHLISEGLAREAVLRPPRPGRRRGLHGQFGARAREIVSHRGSARRVRSETRGRLRASNHFLLRSQSKLDADAQLTKELVTRAHFSAICARQLGEPPQPHKQSAPFEAKRRGFDLELPSRSADRDSMPFGACCMTALLFDNASKRSETLQPCRNSRQTAPACGYRITQPFGTPTALQYTTGRVATGWTTAAPAGRATHPLGTPTALQ